jgi:ABC-2 type transport system ATP-binding protein
VALIDGGRIVAHDHIDGLLRKHKQDNLEQLFLKLTGKEFRDDV